MDLNELYDVPATAGQMGNVSKWAVWKWLQEGKLKRTKIGARTMVRGADIQAFIDACNVEPRPAAASRKRGNRTRRSADAVAPK